MIFQIRPSTCAGKASARKKAKTTYSSFVFCTHFNYFLIAYIRCLSLEHRYYGQLLCVRCTMYNTIRMMRLSRVRLSLTNSRHGAHGDVLMRFRPSRISTVLDGMSESARLCVCGCILSTSSKNNAENLISPDNTSTTYPQAAPHIWNHLWCNNEFGVKVMPTITPTQSRGTPSKCSFGAQIQQIGDAGVDRYILAIACIEIENCF